MSSSTQSVHSSQNIKASESSDQDVAEKNFQLKSLKFWLVIIGMYFAIFLVALDRMIIATAIPKITDEFNSIEDIGWYGSAYMMTAAIFNPLFGRIYRQYSTKWVFISAIVVFEAGSALCGAAPTSNAFIAGRAIAGVGAAGISSGGLMIIIPLVPLRKRPVFIGFFGMAFGLSSVLGPLIGGTFADNSHLTWRWCFYLNLPIGAFTGIATLLFLHLELPQRKKLTVWEQIKNLDPLGLLLFIPSIVSLILALQWGGTTYSWSAPRIIGLLVTFAVLFVVFLAYEVYTPETAMAPTRVILNRSVGGAMWFTFFNAGGMMALVYYLAIWFQAVQGQSAMEAGIRTIPLMMILVVTGIAISVLVQKIGYYVPPLLLAPILSAIGSGMLSTLKPNSGSAQWIGFQVLYGLGIGCGMQTSNLVAQTVLSKADVPIGMGMMFFVQQIGGSIWLSVAQNIFSTQLVKRLSGVAGLDASAVVNTGATDLHRMVPAGELGTVITAYNSALTRAFILSASLSSCAILGSLLIEWRSIKKNKVDTQKSGDSDMEEGKVEDKVQDKA